MTVVLIDDARIVREGLRKIIQLNCPQYQVVGEAGDGEKGLDLIEALKPDVCIIDMKMPKMNGIEMVHRARAAGLSTRFIVLSGYADFHYAKNMIGYGCSGYLLKPVDHQELISLLDSLWHEDQVTGGLPAPIAGVSMASSPQMPDSPVDTGDPVRSLCAGLLAETEYHLLPQRFIEVVSSFYHLGVFHIDQYRKLVATTGDVADGPSRKVAQRLAFLLSRDTTLKSYICPLHPMETLFILGDGEKDHMEALVDSLCTHIHTSSGISLSVGLSGPFTGLDSVVASYSQACEAVSQCFHDKWGAIRWFTQKEVSDESPIFFLVEQQIFRNLTMENQLGVVQQIKRLVDGLIQHAVPKEQCLLVLNRVYVNIRRVLSRQNHRNLIGLLPSAAVFDKQLLACERVGELVAVVQQVLGKLEDYAAEVDETESPRNLVIQKVLRYMDQNYHTGLSLAMVSEVAHMAPSYFSAFFKKETTENYITFVKRMKIERAKELLQNPSVRIYEVSAKVGFDDSKYFSRQFHKTTGMTPKEYQDSVQGLTNHPH